MEREVDDGKMEAGRGKVVESIIGRRKLGGQERVGEVPTVLGSVGGRKRQRVT